MNEQQKVQSSSVPKENHTHENKGASHGKKKVMILILTLTTSFMFIEFFLGLYVNSLALVSDAGHMLNDVFSISLGLVGLQLVMKGSDSKRTYGFNRIEVLFGFIQGLSLLGVSVFIIIQAIERFLNYGGLEIKGGLMLVVAVIGLLVNLIGIFLLHSDHEDNLNVSGVYYHIVADTLGSVAAIIAGIFITLFKWYWTDLLVSFLISILIFQQGLKITIHASKILLEATPENVDMNALVSELLQIPGVKAVNDIHAWSITPDFHILTAHIEVTKNINHMEVIQNARELSKKYSFKHCTFQLEDEPCKNFPECYPPKHKTK